MSRFERVRVIFFFFRNFLIIGWAVVGRKVLRRGWKEKKEKKCFWIFAVLCEGTWRWCVLEIPGKLPPTHSSKQRGRGAKPHRRFPLYLLPPPLTHTHTAYLHAPTPLHPTPLHSIPLHLTPPSPPPPTNCPSLTLGMCLSELDPCLDSFAELMMTW